MPAMATNQTQISCLACDEVFTGKTAKLDYSVHYGQEHVGQKARTRRPVSCWRCGAEIPVTLNDDGSRTIPACGCGFVFPVAEAAS